MIGIIVSAAILGGIIALMQESDFPGWMEMIICAIAALVPTVLLRIMLPESLSLLAPLAGASAATIAISTTCGMTVGRSAIAAGIWFAAQIVLQLGLAWLQSS